MKLNRRQFFRLGGGACGALGFGLFAPLFLKRQILAADPESKKKLIFIFQRGGNDGINTVIPRGDPNYNPENRPSLFIPEQLAIDSGNGFAQLHPRLQPMLDIYNNSGLNGASGPGNLAVLHRIGYANQSRSHFDSQQYWENGVPGNADLDEGFLYRHLDKSLDLTDQSNAFVAAALSSSQMVALQGPKPLPNFSRASEFSVMGTATKRRKFLGSLPTVDGGNDGAGLLGLYGGAPDTEGKPYRTLVHETGKLLGATIDTLESAVRAGNYIPANGAVYPSNRLGEKLQEAAMLFKRTPARVLGLNVGGWDTHSSQGQIYGNHGQLLNNLAQGFQALYRDLQDQWQDIIIVTMTEFGRTSIENGSRGTDHAEASVMFVAGGGVKGGIYNCNSATWQPGDMFSKSGRYLARRTDFRAVFAEIFTRHFGDDFALMDQIIPGYSAAALQDPEHFRFLNFL